MVDFVAGATHETSFTRGPGGGGTQAGIRPIPTLSLKGLLESRGIVEYALVCDIEGAEAAIIQSPAALAGCRQLVIELHDTELGGRSWSEDSLCQAIATRHGMTLRDRYGPVCFFERTGAPGY